MVSFGDDLYLPAVHLAVPKTYQVTICGFWVVPNKHGKAYGHAVYWRKVKKKQEKETKKSPKKALNFGRKTKIPARKHYSRQITSVAVFTVKCRNILEAAD
jgi:hypothetical protein